MNIDSDYNSWVQRSGEEFCRWGYYTTDQKSYSYGSNGPGHNSGDWYTYYGHTSSAPSNGALGHHHADAHSKGTGASYTTLPSFLDVVNHDYSLASSYPGVDLSSKSWYIPEMGRDYNGNPRTIWDMGAFEAVPGGVPDPQPPVLKEAIDN